MITYFLPQGFNYIDLKVIRIDLKGLKKKNYGDGNVNENDI